MPTARAYENPLADFLQSRIDEHHESEKQRRKVLTAPYYAALADKDNPPDEQSTLHIINQINEIEGKPKPLQEGMKKLGEIVGFVGNMKKRNGGQQAKPSPQGALPAPQFAAGAADREAPMPTMMSPAPAASQAQRSPLPAPTMGAAPRARGMITPGNIDLKNRPVVHNADGTDSTVSTGIFGVDGKSVLLPTIINGKRVSDPEAVDHYRKTGEHMGRIPGIGKDSIDALDKYDANLHNEMGWNGAPGSAQAKWQDAARAKKKDKWALRTEDAAHQYAENTRNRLAGGSKTAEEKRAYNTREELGIRTFGLPEDRSKWTPEQHAKFEEWMGGSGYNFSTGRAAANEMNKPQPGSAFPELDPATGVAYVDAENQPLERGVDEQGNPKAAYVRGVSGKLHRVFMPASASPKAGGYIRQGPSTSLADARKLNEAGHKFHDINGDEIDLGQIPENMGLQSMIQGNKIFYLPVSPNQRTVTVGNIKYGVTPWDVKGIGTPASNAANLGQDRVATETTHQETAFNPTSGEVVTNTLLGSSTPQTVGARPPAASPSPVPVPPGTPGGADPRQRLRDVVAAPPAPPPAQGIAAMPQRPAAAAAPSTGVGVSDNPRLRGVPAGSFGRIQERVTPVNEAVTQFLGDPKNPGLKSMKDFAHLADNPGSRDRLQKALRIGLDAARGATPPPSILQSLKDVTGVTAAQRAASANVRQQAIKDLTQEEKDYYNAAMSAYSTVIGLRSLTRASAAEFAAEKIENEIPLIGINTTDRAQFYDQMARLSEIPANGTKGFERLWNDPEMLKLIKQSPAEFIKLRDSARRMPPPQGGIPTVKTQAEFDKLKSGDIYLEDGKKYKKP